MKQYVIIIIIFFFISCKAHKYRNYGLELEKSLAYGELIELIGKTEIDSNQVNAVKIYSYRISNKGKIKDSTLLEYQNLNYYSTFKDHTNYKIKYDSLGRNFERYATRIATGKTHLNYRKTYDAQSNLTLWTVYNRDGQVNFDIRYEYNSDNKLIKETKYYGYFLYEKPELKYVAYYEYPSDNIIKRIRCKENVEMEKCNSIGYTKYDNDRNVIESNIGFLDNGNFQSSEKTMFAYKEKKKISEKYYVLDTLSFVRSYQYNELKLPISTTIEYPMTKYPKQLKKYFYQKNKKDKSESNLCLFSEFNFNNIGHDKINGL
tara:strand:+ start:22389 stop:23342 length:954 start_codon:yes stop_codon:yes gene_type:complete